MHEVRYTSCMKKLLTAWLVLALVTLGMAQTTYQPSCTDTLKQKPWDFIESYTSKNGDQSEAGYDGAALYWADCKDQQNKARLVKLPNLKTKLDNLYRNYNEFFSLETELAYLAAGGGTMYPHGRARFQPSIEIHLGQMIDLLSSKAGASQSVTITTRYNKAKAKLEARLKKVQTTPNPFTDGDSPTEVAAKKHQWLEYAKNYAAQYAAIRKNLGSSINLASTTILEFLAAGLWGDEL
jgi:hypothetical protein